MAIASLSDIERKIRLMADAREALTAHIASLQKQIDAAQSTHMPMIRSAVARARDHESAAVALIEENRGLFEKPKSLTMHGIKFGLRKGSGSLVIEDEETTLALIRKHYPGEAANQYLLVTTKPDKDALKGLPAKELAKLGCELEDSTDVAFARPADSNVDKIVKALLKGKAAE